MHPGIQIGVQVSPFVIELSAIMKLKTTVTSKNEQISHIVNLNTIRFYLIFPTFSFDRIELISEYINDVELRDQHSKPMSKNTSSVSEYE